MASEKVIKPDYTTMILRPLLVPLVIGIPLTIISFWLSLLLGGLIFSLLIFVVVLQAGWANYKYEKTEYILGAEKIRLKSGTPFSDTDIELLWSKVIQAELDCGFIQKYLFGVGDIALEAAGQAEAEIRLRHLSTPADRFELLLENLPEKTSLVADELIESYHQSKLGIWLDFFVPLFVLAFLMGTGGWLVLTFSHYQLETIEFLVPAAMFLLLFIFLTFFLSYKSLVKIFTTYRLYDRYIVSETNFLGLAQRIIPLSMLSDVNVSFPLHKRLFELGNLELSVPGLGEELSLKNLGVIDTLRQQLQDRSDQIKQAGESRESPPVKEKTGKSFTASPVLFCHLFPTLIVLVISALGGAGLGYSLVKFLNIPFYLNLGISLAPSLLVLPFFLSRLVAALASSFAVEGNRVELTFTFLNKSVTSLSTDKIKAIVRSQGIIERLFNTYSVTFHSIGTEKNVKFFALRDSHENKEMIRQIRKYEGSTGGEEKERLFPELTIPGVVFQHPLVLLVPPVIFFLPALILGLTVSGLDPALTIGAGTVLTGLVTGGDLWYLNFYYSNCVSLALYDDYLIYETGYFQTQTYYVIYKDIRNVEYAREPIGEGGWLLVDFSGQGGGNENSRNQQSTSKGFTFRHLPAVDSTARAVEEVFAGEIPPDKLLSRRKELANQTATSLLTAKPLTLPYVVLGAGYGLFALLFVEDVLLTMDMLILGPVIISAGAIIGSIYRYTISYTIKDNQIEASHWLIFTRTKSIKYQNVDNLEIDRNIFDKILGTGTLLVSTTGGSDIELKARFIRNYREFYEQLQDEYNEATTGETI